MTVPPGAVLRTAEDGSVALYSGPETDAVLLGAAFTPWVKDANGNPVPTRYSLDGNALIQTVDFNQNTAFPVVADPWYNPFSKSWRTTWKIAGCAAAIGGFIAGNGLLISKAAKFGGVYRGAKLIVQAGNASERWKLAMAIFGNVAGITGMVSWCTP
jgi:hypothetical protein